MGKGYKHGGAGGGGFVGLNFEIVGGTTQPSNPKENTIWVNTDQEITNWLFDNLPGTIVESTGTVLGTIYDRTFTKAYGGKAAYAMCYIADGNYTGPMLVSPSPEASAYSASDGSIPDPTAPLTVSYAGKTYYYATNAWYSGN